MRSESMAYATASHKISLLNRLLFLLRFHFGAILATSIFFLFVMILTSDSTHRGSISKYDSSSSSSTFSSSNSMLRKSYHYKHSFAGAIHPGYFFLSDSIQKSSSSSTTSTSLSSSISSSSSFSSSSSSMLTLKFAAVTDLDQLSRVKDSPSSKPTFRSILISGSLSYDSTHNLYTIVKMDPSRELLSAHNEAGRGAEFSELTLYDNRLLTFDDRTGTIFEILNKNNGRDSYVVPRILISEGAGNTDKGMKWEWATVKDDELYVGSMGKEYTLPDGTIVNTNNLWIIVVDSMGRFRRVDWKRQYDFVREQLGASAPGYVWHEAVLWSNYWKKWIFMPRRVSSEKYDEVEDEKRGSHLILMVDDKFTKASVVQVRFAQKDPLRGFSSISFVPGTNDRHVLALRSIEEDCVGGDESKCKQRSYFSVIDIQTGDVLMEEVRIDLDMKFEGVAFVDISTPETAVDS